MNGTELLTQIFANVRDERDEVARNTGRIGGAIKDPSGPVKPAYDWLVKYGVPIVEAMDCDLPHGVLGLFHLVPPQRMVIRYNAAFTPDNMWVVWHECGHCADYLRRADDKVHFMAQGWLSTKHANFLQMHQEEIIKWTPHPNRQYKTRLDELWAEVIAATMIDPARVPAQIERAIRPDLLAIGLPIGAPAHGEEKNPKSFKCEFLCQGSWSSNAMRFATQHEADLAGGELMSRWYVPTDRRVVETSDPVNARFNEASFKAELLS